MGSSTGSSTGTGAYAERGRDGIDGMPMAVGPHALPAPLLGRQGAVAADAAPGDALLVAPSALVVRSALPRDPHRLLQQPRSGLTARGPQPRLLGRRVRVRPPRVGRMRDAHRVDRERPGP